MTQVFAFSSTKPVGVSFLEWSLHYLNGKDTYFHAIKNQNIELTQNPLTKTNAHNHDKCHPAGYEHTKQVLKSLKNTNQKEFVSFYPTVLYIKNAFEILQTKNFNDVVEYVKDDYNKMVNEILMNDVPFIYIYTDPSVSGYLNELREFPKVALNSNKEITSLEEYKEDYNSFFFETNNTSSISEKREIDALNIRPYNTNLLFNINLKKSHLWFNCKDVWTNTEEVMVDIFDYLNLSINVKSLENWKPICYEWQKIHNKTLKFYNNIDHILDCIVNGYYYELNNLTYNQEVVLLHLLIYKYNINLKLVDKFPTNTKYFETLFEENFHKVEKVY